MSVNSNVTMKDAIVMKRTGRELTAIFREVSTGFGNSGVELRFTKVVLSFLESGKAEREKQSETRKVHRLLCPSKGREASAE